MCDKRSDVGQDFSLSARPVAAAAWRGRFIIPRHSLDINISAHVPNKGCLKVLEAASGMPDSLVLEINPRLDVWPTSFKSSLLNENSIGLFFFSDRRDDAVLDSLVSYAISNDFALKAMIGNAELLIFTSVVLPETYHRFQGKHYLWGVFRGQETASSHQSGSNVHKTVSSNSIAPMRVDKADRRGRRLDAAWEHAKPLDVLRQKAQCRHCGFISSHGGISRLKAHLGGGNPKIHLPGCNMVPPQVKKLMTEWFSEWLKSTKALWTKEIRGKAPPEIKEEVSERMESSIICVPPERKILMSDWVKTLTPTPSTKKSQDATQSETRGRPLDNAWEHGKPLDKARQMTRCNYCGFVSTYGGISRLKAHLGGGSPQMQLQGCPQVSLQVKYAMQKWFEEWSINSKALWTKRSHVNPNKPSKRGRPVNNEIWEHAIWLDEMREAVKCKYCGFVSKIGGVDRLKAHLAGGDHKMQLEGCPHVPPEVKSSLSDGTKKLRKKAKSLSMMTVGGVSQGPFERKASDTQWSEKRHHILQETLDEITNTSLKTSLKKIIDNKNANVQKMQVEILSLQNQLASIP